MKTINSNFITSFLVISLLVTSSGCLISSHVVYKAEGFTDERIDRSRIERGDKIGVMDAEAGAYYVIKYPKDKDNSKLPMPVIPEFNQFYICRPHPAYYALLPLTLPVDIVIFPYTIFVICTSPPVSH